MAGQQSREYGLIESWVREAGDPMVHPDSEYLESVQHKMLDRLATTRSPARWPLRMRVFAGFAIAMALPFILILWAQSVSVSWAEVREAVQARPWIHLVAKGPDGEKAEIWLSATKKIAATRIDSLVTHDDMRLKIRHTFDPARGVIVRVPAPEAVSEEIRRLDATLCGILRDDVKVGSSSSQLELVGEHRCEVERDGRKWIEYELSFHTKSSGTPRHTITRQLVLRVDPKTRLPRSIHLTDRFPDREQEEIDFQLNYPDDGPADIYALGVPRSVELEDRIPSGDGPFAPAGAECAGATSDNTRRVRQKRRGSTDGLGRGSPGDRSQN